MLFLIVYLLLKVYYVHHVLIWLPERREIIDYYKKFVLLYICF